MRLRNKITGEVKEFVLFDGKNELQGGATLKDLMIEWEDYVEPKNQFYLDCDGRIFENHTTDYMKGKMQEIGNYFETREEAEKAVEKLKAWKRLKDKGFRFESYKPYGTGITFTIAHMNKLAEDNQKDLNLLFGGEK